MFVGENNTLLMFAKIYWKHKRRVMAKNGLVEVKICGTIEIFLLLCVLKYDKCSKVKDDS